MLHYICTTCGVQYEKSEEVPSICTICSEERQYVNVSGQEWTTLREMRGSNLYRNEIVQQEDGLYRIHTEKKFAIGQNAFLITGTNFNMLWDCITYLDDITIQEIKELGGIHAIALSHPHYYSTQVEWAEVFDVPIYIHEDDKEWVMRPSERIVFWSGDSLSINEEITIYRLGGHFKGGAVLHWQGDNKKDGILLTGDIIQVVEDQQWVSFMYSYPNLIPLPANKVKEMVNKVKDVPFDRLYNAFQKVVNENANEAVQRSAKRYVKALEGTLFNT
ncbi:MBL fold metallo-hydrolase [Priestia taiwanensis]|uniref:Hydrolase n=1 Tax=Priestia taiwanensis TaxID=1347902 RepID=A0A917EMQ6_9BACI|nr:MBL fold metallo-hydrolase [Priestia taiwanensis]MBM7362640.1 hypothetical protein [Priestia taiwanensis]GGE63884.1 hydrolase [Priestia taiwanensis]